MRVVAGTLRGRSIEAPPGRLTRPTTDRTREAVFNSLTSMGVLEGATVMDLFAGSGALGIEALSRGASSCTFVDSDSVATEVISRNLRTLGLVEQSRVVAGRVETVIRSLGPADLVLVDPPYGYEGWADLLRALGSAVAEDGTVVVESGSDITPEVSESGTFELLRTKRYGRTWVAFLQRS